MRLVSCIGLLMVIPAVALLTRSHDMPVEKQQAVKNLQSAKSTNAMPQKTLHTDSIQHAEANSKPNQNHMEVTVSNNVKSNTITTAEH